MNNLVLLTGTVASPTTSQEAQRLVQAYVGEGTQVGQPAALGDAAAGQPQGPHRRDEPLAAQAVRRQPAQQGQRGGIPVRHRPAAIPARSTRRARPTDHRRSPAAVRARSTTRRRNDARPVRQDPRRSTCSARSTCWRTTASSRTLAEPNLTALSGETASFLAGGEFPIPVSQALGAVDHRVQAIWRRPRLHAGRPCRRPHLDARPSRSQRAERRRLGQAQRLHRSGADHAPRRNDGRARLRPVVHDRRPASEHATPTTSRRRRSSATCRSSARCSARPSYRRDETELVIIVTPYLVRPVSSQLALPTDGYRAPTTSSAMFLGQTYTGKSGLGSADRGPGAPAAPAAGARRCRSGVQAVTRGFIRKDATMRSKFVLIAARLARWPAAHTPETMPDRGRRRRSTCRS